MKYIGKVLWSIVFLLILGLSGCMQSHIGGKSAFKGFDIQKISFDSIENTQMQYTIDLAQKNLYTAKTDEEKIIAKSQLDLLLGGLNPVGEATADGSNKDNPIAINSGEFYMIAIHCKPPKSYQKSFTFSLSLVDSDDNTSVAIGIGQTPDINSTDEFDVSINALIPTSITPGKYLLVAVLSGGDDNNTIEGSKEAGEIPQVGIAYVDIRSGNDAKRVDLIGALGSPYIDLPYQPKFINGYSNQDAQKSTLALYNHNNKEENITLSATLQLTTGETTSLGLLDTTDGAIKDAIPYPISPHRVGDIGPSRIVVSFYLPEEKYQEILNAIPDLSEDNRSEQRARIIWQITSNDPDLESNPISQPMFLSKFVDNIDLSQGRSTKALSSMPTNKRIDRLGSNGAGLGNNVSCVRFNKYSDQSEEGWKDAVNIPNYPDSQNSPFNIIVDAALDFSEYKRFEFYEEDTAKNYAKKHGAIVIREGIIGGTPNYGVQTREAYLFSGDQYVIYNGYTKSVSNPKKIKDLYSGFTFSKIDAAFKRYSTSDKIYLFSGNKYLKVDTRTHKVVSGYPRTISDSTWPGLSKLKTISAAVSYYNGKGYFFGRDSRGRSAYVRYDWDDDEVDSGYPRRVTESNWESIGDIEVSACFADPHARDTVCFQDKTLNNEKLKKDGILFKYDGSYNRLLGSKDYIGLSVHSKYSSVGRWDVPGVNNHAELDVSAHLFDNELGIITVDAEAAIGIGALYRLDGEEGPSKTDRTGRMLSVTVFGGEIVNKSSLSSHVATEHLSKENIHDLLEAKDNGTDILTASKEWSEKKVIFTQRFTVGPVPFSIKGGIEGDLEIMIALGLDGTGVELRASAPASLGVFAKGGPDVGVISAGIGCDVTAIRAEGGGAMHLGISADNDNNLNFSLRTNADFDLKVLKGELYLYATVQKIECNWHSCWWEEDESRRYLYSSPWLYQRSWNLVDKTFGTPRILELSDN